MNWRWELPNGCLGYKVRFSGAPPPPPPPTDKAAEEDKKEKTKKTNKKKNTTTKSILLWTALTQALEAECPHSVNLNEVPLAQNPVRVN